MRNGIVMKLAKQHNILLGQHFHHLFMARFFAFDSVQYIGRFLLGKSAKPYKTE
jgi:hypothetical protein